MPVLQAPRFFNGDEWRAHWSKKDYPLVFSTYKPILRSNYSAAFDHCVEISPENFVYMNEATAKQYGLATSDLVVVSTPNGKPVTGKLRADKGVAPGAVCIGHCYDHTNYGSEDRIVDGQKIEGIKKRGGGVAVNQMIPHDPTRPGRLGMLNEFWAACNCRSGIPVRVVKA